MSITQKNEGHFCPADDHPTIWQKTSSHRFHHHGSNLASPKLFQYAVFHYMPRFWIQQNKRDLELARLEFQAVETLLQTWQHQFQLGSQLENYLCNMRTRTIHAAPWIMQSSMWPCNFTVIGSLSIVVHWSKNTILIYLAEVMCLYVHTIDLCHSNL